MSWLFSRALVAEYSEANSLDGEPFALLNATPMQQAYWLPDKTTDTCPRFRSGMTCKPLTAAHGEALLTWFRAAFPAKTSVQPEKAQASTANAPVCGDTWRELSVKFDPLTSSWKTHRCLFPEVLPWSSVTLPRWGMMQGGELWERTTPGLPTSETGSGFWPTPRASEASKQPNDKNRQSPCLSWVVKHPEDMPRWQTPTVQDSNGRTHHNQRDGSIRPSLLGQVMWQTPVADDAVNRTKGKFNSRGEPKLSAQVKMWPTLVATMSKGSSPAALTRKNGRSRINDRLDHNVMPSDGGQLNPNWVEWLMGWPIEWTASEPLETARFQQWSDSHGKS